MRNLKLLLTTIFISGSTFLTGQLSDVFKTELDQGIKDLVEIYNATGISIAVISGEDEWSGAEGISSLQDSLNTDHVLALGSITKPIVSACILGLMEEEKLQLSDPIHMYLEEREHINSNITIKQLLYHTSGIYNYTDHPTFFDTIFENDSKFFEAEEILDQFLRAPSFTTGQKQEYSNTNYLLLGMIIEEITGRPYYEEIVERFNTAENYPSLTGAPYIQNPEDMAHLWFDLGFGKIDFQASGISLNSIFSAAAAAGAFVATPIDLARFGNDLLSGELLTEASMDSFYNYHPFQLFGQVDYGLGIAQVEAYCGVTSVSHSGGILYSADLHYVEEFDLTVAVMTNDGEGLPQIGGVGGISQEIICAFQTSLTDIEETDIASKSRIQVYPNPFNDHITIEIENDFQESITLELFDNKGQLLNSKQETALSFNQRMILDPNLAPGIYFLRCTVGNQSEMQKLVKM